MAKRGTPHRHSQEHEDYVASVYRGKRSPSSGAADNDSGDVRTPLDLIECKLTGGPGGDPKKSVSVSLSDFTKIAEEAYGEGKSPVVALRIWSPGNILANPFGWVDLSVRLLSEDVELRYGSEI